jgi:hypothetical protein
MVALIRQFLVLMLVLLQFAAPLVHAHIGESAPVRGLHLHEFENLHLQKTDTFAQATLDHVSCVASAIVELGSAIKLESPNDDFSADCYLPSSSPVWVSQPVLKVINFSPHQGGNHTAPTYNQHLTRAPPA